MDTIEFIGNYGEHAVLTYTKNRIDINANALAAQLVVPILEQLVLDKNTIFSYFLSFNGQYTGWSAKEEVISRGGKITAQFRPNKSSLKHGTPKGLAELVVAKLKKSEPSYRQFLKALFKLLWGDKTPTVHHWS